MTEAVKGSWGRGSVLRDNKEGRGGEIHHWGMVGRTHTIELRERNT